MSSVSRVGDLGSGECLAGHPDVPKGSPKPYITTHITGASTVFTNNSPQAVVGSIGSTDCGHTTMAITGSATVFAEFMAIHRVGDVGAINEGDGTHIVITGSDSVSAGDNSQSSSSGGGVSGSSTEDNSAFGNMAAAVDEVINNKLPSYLSKK